MLFLMTPQLELPIYNKIKFYILGIIMSTKRTCNNNLKHPYTYQ